MFNESVSRHLVPPVPDGAFARVRSTTQAVAFWLAVALPLAYLPAVVATAAPVADPGLFAWALVGNLVAIVLGHGHQPGAGRRPNR